MTKKIGKKAVSGVQSTTETKSVEGTESVSGVGSIKPTSSVGGIGGATRVTRRRATRIMSSQERDQLFQMISEEADKLVSEGILPKGQKDVVSRAVRMAVDAGLVDEDDKEE